MWRCWLGAFASNLDHTNGVTQTAMTIAGAYGCFYVAEGMLGASGVMAVVFMGGYLARTFWPVLADPDLLRGTCVAAAAAAPNWRPSPRLDAPRAAECRASLRRRT